MSNNMKKKDKKSIMNTVKKGLKSMRNASSNKTNKSKQTPRIKNKHIVTPIPTNEHYLLEDNDSNSSSTRKSSFIPSFSYKPKSPSSSQKSNLSPFFGASDSHSAISRNKNINKNTESQRLIHRKNDSIVKGLSSTKKSTQKLKSSNRRKHRLPFNRPSLFINKRPDNILTSSNEFNHLLYDRNGTHMNQVVISINIDIEQVYNEEYDNNYNRKLLGPLQPVKLPLIIDICNKDNEYYIQNEFELISDQEDEIFSNINIGKETKSLNQKPIAKQTMKLKRKHKKSASTSAAPDPFAMKLHAFSSEILTRQRTRTAMAHGYAQIPSVPINFRPEKIMIDNNNNNNDEKIDKKAQHVQGVNLKFENKYNKISKITPDELEILARKLLTLNAYDSTANNTNSIGIDGKHGSRIERKGYIHPKNKLKKNQHNHLLQSNVERKSESVSFGLQLINSIKQITSMLQNLMITFSDGLNDLLRICEQFISLVINPLPRQVWNDYNHKILQYTNLVKIIDEMSSNFYDSSQNLKDNMPSLEKVLQSNISNRINQYESYSKDMKAADMDIKSLQIHCDRTLRRLFRELPRPIANDYNDNSPDLNRKKSLKQHKGIRIFGEHYVASNSNEHICRSVPSKIRSNILANYIHYVTLMDATNLNIKKSYSELLPQLGTEFEESQEKLKTQIDNSLNTLDNNLTKKFKNNQINNDIMHRYNKNKPSIEWKNIFNRAKGNIRKKTKPLIPIKPYRFHKNVLLASPMHTNDVITKIREYVNEEYEKKAYDEFEMVKVHKKNFKDQKLKENGKFNLLKNYGIKFDSANFINDEVIQNFFNNHYYHLGDILFEIPELYEAFEDYLKTKLSAENLYFLRQIDDIYFNLDHVTFNHLIAIKQTKNIYNTFISDESKQQINLPGNVRKKIAKDLKKISKFKDPLEIFDKAYENISHLIHKESLPNFYKSQHFKNWYDKQREKNEKALKKERKMVKK